MKRIHIAMAEPIGLSAPVPVTIEISEKLVRFRNLKSQARYFKAEADGIAQALVGSLPQATLERLIARLIELAASHYVGAIRLWDAEIEAHYPESKEGFK